MNIEQAVSDFHKKFQLEYNGPARALPDDMVKFRVDFLQEELDEYKKAIEEGNLENQFDALLDLVYVAVGNAHLQGFPFNEGMSLVQAANMSKIRALRESDSKRGSTYDVVKPEGWTPPNHKPLIEATYEKKMD